MARLEDYLPKTNELDDEITQAVVQTSERKETAKTTIPDRFSGKTTEQVVESYTELEKMNSRQAQDLGDMRKQVDALMRQSLEQANTQQAPAEEHTPVTVDELYDNPEEAIERVIERRVRPAMERQEELIAGEQRKTRIKQLDETYEGWEDVVKSNDFDEWVGKTAYRQRMAGTVRETGDLDAADDLLAQYYEQSGKDKAERETNKARKSQALADATLTSGGAAYDEPTETLSRRELMNVRIRAKQGDRQAGQWLQDNQNSIATAYAEGRVVD